MRSGFCVWANACKCHASFPAISLRPFTDKRSVATLLTFATFAENSSAPPIGGANPAGSAGAAAASSSGFAAFVLAFPFFVISAEPDSGVALERAAGGSGVKVTDVLLWPPACNHTNAAAPQTTAKITASTVTIQRLMLLLRSEEHTSELQSRFGIS